MQITFLGTSSMVPTKERNQIAVFLNYGTEGILFDCGEGTQRQFKIAGISLTKITKILISHWHGDHVLGLPGIIQSLSSMEYDSELLIYGPVGTEKRIEKLFEAFVFDKQIRLKIIDVKGGMFFEGNDFQLEALPLEHGIEILGYNFIEKNRRRIDTKKIKKLKVPEGPLLGKLQQGENVEFKGQQIIAGDVTYIKPGKKITFITDTILCDNCYRLANSADLLICEATYSSKLVGKSEEYGHMTAKQAAQLANKADVKQLILIPFSSSLV